MDYNKQVDKVHYSFEKYFTAARWMSYWYQTKEIASRSEIKTILDIGPGTTFLKDVLTIHRPDIRYESVDIAEDLEPDHVGSITKLPLQDKSFDVVCAFEVLEHVEFSDFEVGLNEMKRVSKQFIPHQYPGRKPVGFSFHATHVYRGGRYLKLT